MDDRVESEGRSFVSLRSAFLALIIAVLSLVCAVVMIIPTTIVSVGFAPRFQHRNGRLSGGALAKAISVDRN